MAGETIKTKGIVLDIRPWSRTSHIVTWLTPDRGPVTTLVKGAVRPKSAFLGQYDLFYTCELIYYARSKGELHAIREASVIDACGHLRGDFRATAFASYAAYLVKEHCPHSGEAETWFGFLERMLDCVREETRPALRTLIAMETEFLSLAGLSPDFAGADLSSETSMTMHGRRRTPTSLAVRSRRSPAISSYIPFGIRRTISGCSTPF